MKALVLRSYGPPDQLELAHVDTPVPAADEVLVRVRATSVNPYDWHHMRGEPRVARMMPGTLGLRAPKLRILGCDVAGQVEAVGQDVTDDRLQPAPEAPAVGVVFVTRQGLEQPAAESPLRDQREQQASRL